MTNKIMCTYLSQQESQSAVICNVVYWPCPRQQRPTATIAQGSPNIVNIDLLETLPVFDYCYAVNASNGMVTIIIEGTIESSESITLYCNIES